MVLPIFLDFETRSKVNLSKCGLFRYAADPSTLPLMLAYGEDPKNMAQWSLSLPHDPENIPACPSDLRALIEDPRVEFHAHNAGFEVAIWE